MERGRRSPGWADSRGAIRALRGGRGALSFVFLAIGLMVARDARTLAAGKRVVAVEPRPSGDAALRLDTGETVVASRRYKQALEAIDAKS